MDNQITLEVLQKEVASAVAIRRAVRLQPAGGIGDKIFPPTYEGGQYALEQRVIAGTRRPCVLLDSVQSQANRMELALLDAHRAGRIVLPLVEVDFPTSGMPEVGVVTSLEAPHRLADAILRDSMRDGRKFRDSEEGRMLDSATLANASGIFGLCPTALVFGLWDSTGPRGGLGIKFQRAVVSELVGVDIEGGTRPSSRIDPLNIQLNAGPVFRNAEGLPTLDPDKALKTNGKPVLFGKKKDGDKLKDVVFEPSANAKIPDEGRPSKANHGNVTPSLINHDQCCPVKKLQRTTI